VVELEDETIGLRSRMKRLRLSLSFISEPLAVILLRGVIADMEARIAAVEAERQLSADGVQPP
jgi:hypothetical protein